MFALIIILLYATNCPRIVCRRSFNNSSQLLQNWLTCKNYHTDFWATDQSQINAKQLDRFSPLSDISDTALPLTNIRWILVRFSRSCSRKLLSDLRSASVSGKFQKIYRNLNAIFRKKPKKQTTLNYSNFKWDRTAFDQNSWLILFE